MKVDAFEGVRIFSPGSHAAQHRIAVPRCLILKTRNAVEAVNRLAPKLPDVLRESSRTVRVLAFSRIILKFAKASKRSSEYK